MASRAQPAAAAGSTYPGDVTPIFWVKADSLSLANNDPVSTWTDSSGGGHDATGSGAARPTYKTGIQNGLPVVRFDGSDDWLSVSGLSQSGNAKTIVVVIATQAATTGRPILDIQTGRLFLPGYGTGGAGWVGFYDGSWKEVNSGNSTAAQTIVWSFSSTTGTIYRDGSSLGSEAYVGLNIGGSIGIGNDYVGSSPWSGDLCELLIYDHELSGAERGSVLSSLKTKWGTP